jgi:hypothetical protein
MVGVAPANFRCHELISIAAVSQILQGQARLVETAMPTPVGLAPPCSYLVTAADERVEPWMFDIDCRDGMKARADALFEQYQSSSADLALQLPADGKARKIADAAHAIDVGGKGLDHHGQGLVFVDDDAPCYVRVIGPGAPRRLALAQRLALELTPSTAPMTPRPRSR